MSLAVCLQLPEDNAKYTWWGNAEAIVQINQDRHNKKAKRQTLKMTKWLRAAHTNRLKKHSLHLLFHITPLRAINVTEQGRKHATKCCLESVFALVRKWYAHKNQPTHPWSSLSTAAFKNRLPPPVFIRSPSSFSFLFPLTFPVIIALHLSVLPSERALPTDTYAHC